LNRQVDIYDDAVFLLNGGRVSSACIVSRGMIETYAIAKLIGDKIFKILSEKDGAESLDECDKVLLNFINSSRIKVSEQEKLRDRIFDPNEYTFTPEALQRMESSLASNEHVMNALRNLYKFEMKTTGAKESRFMMIYDILSEWVHPSQTSVFHHYTPETHMITTSHGPVHLHTAAQLNCLEALHFITDSMNMHDWLISISEEMSQRAIRRRLEGWTDMLRAVFP